MLLLSSILIIYKWLENANNRNNNLKIKIYYIILKTILQHIYLLLTLRKKNTNNVSILLEYKNNIKLIYINSYKKCYYLIFTGFIINYKRKNFIINMKTNMQYSIS